MECVSEISAALPLLYGFLHMLTVCLRYLRCSQLKHINHSHCLQLDYTHTCTICTLLRARFHSACTGAAEASSHLLESAKAMQMLSALSFC